MVPMTGAALLPGVPPPSRDHGWVVTQRGREHADGRADVVGDVARDEGRPTEATAPVSETQTSETPVMPVNMSVETCADDA